MTETTPNAVVVDANLAPTGRMTPHQILSEAPARIRKAEQDLFEGRAAIDRIRLELKTLEAHAMQRVASATGADGKKAYPNAEAREAAVNDALRQDPGAADLRRQLDERMALNARVQAFADYWRDLQRNARVLLMARTPLDVILDTTDVGA
jgi:hypothetical protein